MENGLLHLHNLMRWVVLLFMLLTLISSLSGMSGNKPFTSGNRKTALFMMISADIQLLLGVSLYIMRGWWSALSSGGGGVMKEPVTRFWSVEHMAGMLIGIVFIHIAYSAAKKDVPDGAKFKRVFLFTLLALIIILITIPWPFREGIGRPWFPGMSVNP